ncbi:glycine cleavage system aminomethyltransferase GcvT [Nitriliruptoraceae bacterium ZYF776]|nr:glycine cleavage system aminomethyltransferase GcvT [Profundirhabdus halotolerans]
MDDLRRTPLTARHEAAGAKLAPFAGWAMPLEYTGTLAEHAAVRERVGVFDVSHLGTVWVTGPAATAVVDASFSNDARALADGTSQYTLCLDDDGGVLDDLIVYRLSAQRWFVVPNAANTAVVVDRLRDRARAVAAQARPEVVEAATADDPDPAGLAVGTALVDDASVGWAILAVQGPAAVATLTEVLGTDVGELPTNAIVEVRHAAAGPVIVCRTGYTGEAGAELLVPAENAGAVWDQLTAAGAVPCGLGARDTLRLEMGYPLHGNDLGPSVTPWRTRLRWAVKLASADGAPRDFPGRAALAATADDEPTDRLWGLRSDGRRPLRAGCEVVLDGEVVGTTTSGGFAPSLGVGIALAQVARLAPGDRAQVRVRDREVDVEVVRPPFLPRDRR